MSMWARSAVVGVGRRKAIAVPSTDAPIITQPRGLESGYALLDAHAFRNAMNVLVSRAGTVFTVLVIRPELLGLTLSLGETILRQLRGSSGDLVGYLDGAIAVTLHRTDHVGAVAFADRVRDEWRRAGEGELLIDIAEHPLAEQRVIELLTADWSASSWIPLVIEDGHPSPYPARRDAAADKRTGLADRQ